MINQVKTVLLLGTLSALLIWIGGALGPGYLGMFTILAVAMNIGSYFFSDKLVLAMNGAREIAPDEAPWLHEMVADLAKNGGVPKPRVYLIPQQQPNAFATGRNPSHAAVAVTQGITELLSRRELRGVLAHEMGHVVNRDILISSIAATIASAISSLANMVMLFGFRSSDDRDSSTSPLLMAFIAPFAATIIQLAISRSREYIADATGARLCSDPEALASALEKLERGAQSIPAHVAPSTASLFIVNPFAGMHGFVNLFSTHPPMKERIARLRALALEFGSNSRLARAT